MPDLTPSKSTSMVWHQQLRDLQTDAAAKRWRLPLWLQGEVTWLATELQQLLPVLSLRASHPAADTPFLWLGQSCTAFCMPDGCRPIAKTQQLLGLETDCILINATQGIDWELLAAASGCLRAGGLWILLSLPAAQFAEQPNPLAQKLLSYPADASSQPSFFSQFWLSLQQDWLIWTASGWLVSPPQWRASQQLACATTSDNPEQTAPKDPQQQGLTRDQQEAIAAILQVVRGHRRRPLVLSAHRGRGKSAALGIAAALLHQAGKRRLVISSAHPAGVAVALQHATLQAKHDKVVSATDAEVLQFMPLDQLLQQRPPLDLLLLDEAATIPLPQLQQLTLHYSRIVFATTEHGYEGTGQAFSLKFQPFLQQHCPGWRRLELRQPIRYGVADPLERQIFRSFLLTPELGTPDYQPEQPLAFTLHDRTTLGQQPQLLREIFALLSLAHYQTEVADLWALLDNPSLQLWSVQQHQQVLGAVLVNLEGGLDPALSQQIFYGQRRVQGHLLAQSLAFHLAQPDLACLPLARIQRLVIHPALQQQGIGRWVLQQLHDCYQPQRAILGTSFGMTPALGRFWQQAGFVAVKLSAQPDHASGAPSVLMLRALKPGWQAAVAALGQAFSQRLFQQLPDQHQDLSPELVFSLYQPQSEPLSAADCLQLRLFCQQQRPFELVDVLLSQWLHQAYPRLCADDRNLAVAKLWQKKPWHQLQAKGEATGKTQLINRLRKMVQQTLPND